MVPYSEVIDLSNYVESGEFNLIRTGQRRLVTQYTCCPEPYPHMLFIVHLKRKTLYYMYTVIVPCLIMSGLSIVVFFVPPDSSEKISLGISVFLTFSVYVLMIAEKVPETSDAAPLISIYLSVGMTTTGISTLMTVLVLNVHHMRHRPVPIWVKRIVNILCKILRIQAESEAIRKCSAYKNLRYRNSQIEPSLNKPLLSKLEGSENLTTYELLVLWNEIKNADCSMKILKVIRDKVVSCHLRHENIEASSHQWKIVAVIIDRFLFLIFTAATALTILTFMVRIFSIPVPADGTNIPNYFMG